MHGGPAFIREDD